MSVDAQLIFLHRTWRWISSCMFPLCGSVFVKFIKITVFSLFHDQRMCAAGIQARWSPEFVFIVQYFLFLSKCLWVLNHRVWHFFYLEHSGMWTIWLVAWHNVHSLIRCATFLLCVNFYKSWCFLQTGDAVIEGACIFIFLFIFLPLLLVSFTTTATDYCSSHVCLRMRVRALLWSNNCGCVWCCTQSVCVCVFSV